MIDVLSETERAAAIARSLMEQALRDPAIAEAVLMAAAGVEAGQAYDAGVPDPAEELERLLGEFRRAARDALAVIRRREGAAA